MEGILGKIVYWLAVLVISLALLVALVLFFESRDDSTLGQGAVVTGWPAAGRAGVAPGPG